MQRYYGTDEPMNEARPLELEVAIDIEDAIDTLEGLADDLRKASRQTNLMIQQSWRVAQKERRRP